MSIRALKADIATRFGKESGGIYFGILQLTYQPKPERLIITLSHYATEHIEYKLTFKGVYSYRLTQETYITYFDEENFSGFSFFEFSNNSRFKKDILENYSLSFVLGDDKEKINKIVSYRIVGQNSFIDILTSEEPEIELIE